eukprot:g25.t1 g25   contig1:58370-58834(+)
MDNNLLCPMQCRMNGVSVNEIPKFLVDNPTNVTHSLVFPMQEQDDDTQPTIIPLALDGVTSYFLVTKPTQEDVEDKSMLHLDLTAENPPWNPQDLDFAQWERNMVDSAGSFNIPDTTARGPVECMDRQQRRDEEHKYTDVNVGEEAQLYQLSCC